MDEVAAVEESDMSSNRNAKATLPLGKQLNAVEASLLCKFYRVSELIN